MDNETILELLNSNFKTCILEKHPYANMKSLITQASDKVLGKNFKGTKIGVKKQIKIHDIVLKQMHARYGSLVNIKIMNIKKWSWATNLNQVYKTEHGRLFGTYLYDDFFFTSHSLDRWDERIDQEKFKYFSQFFKLRYHTEATSMDKLIFTIQMPHQIGLKRNQPSFRYLNVNQGCVIIEILGGICIAKTFLSLDMVKDEKYISWFNYDKPVMKDISECLTPSEDLLEDFCPLNEEVPIDFCIKLFKVM